MTKTTELICEAPEALTARPAPSVATPAPRLVLSFSRPIAESSRFVPVLTLVLWLGCSLVAAMGFVMPYVRPQPAKAQPEPLQVEMLNVELSNDPLPDLEPPPASALATPPPAEAIAQPQLPQAVAVAMPSPAIAFALPVEGPVRVVNAAQASYARAEAPTTTAAAALPVQQLVFGQGAGKQPAPEYPLVAQDAGQEGMVSVRFVVAENGRVTAADAVAPSPWPLLNDSALRTIRNRWRFGAGQPRAFEVTIRFVLPK